ncbi:uncharacterized protein LY89DRAFT_702512 [Mollisia scopiformis]|uniref:Hemerythrin-like domain-containing protein n=1 Tax=Mollisia scopiformis TaxID=149040 RepID=A0A132B510_MOLSC|nr:uncharacterized protein LY89DRAFT_702512 [Mollisia scopiformis]KUJ07079.1 hypothetical protein LY89DRAFT_702512 [Mollisia scopiformis]
MSTTATTPPIYSDSPLALIATPQFETGKDDPFTVEASHMALSHNAFIRGFNSIYQTAPRLTLLADKKDFVGYCLAWVDCVSTHHHYEETELFPNINKNAGQTGLMAGAVHEQELFQGGMEKFRGYLVEKAENFKSDELISIMDCFKEPLWNHLKAEPPPLSLLRSKKQVGLSIMFNILPVFFLNMETVQFEGGMWHEVFPPLKGLGRTVMNKVVPKWQSGQWRFCSCDADGKVKPLAV